MAALIIGLSAPALARANDAVPTTPAKPAQEDLVCEYRQMTGSNLRQKICVSREQKEMEERLAREYMEETFKNGTTIQKGK